MSFSTQVSSLVCADLLMDSGYQGACRAFDFGYVVVKLYFLWQLNYNSFRNLEILEILNISLDLKLFPLSFFQMWEFSLLNTGNFMYIYIIHIHMHMYPYTHIHVYTRTYTNICVHIYINTCIQYIY